ncbi:TetR/AcrR family transcriptional regulator [Wenzhouxiangella sp. EGI_FJ10305]|uniref:TetR/AcrR family transcriptional regulator n=1 Tax=Wenzhouxiangella sp. EGI_FJ10305 TaxID=3243768 RepID=UPI0035DF1017
MTKSSTERNGGGDKPSLTPADWEQEALALIAEKGIAALRVEPLARRLGITKGSFYWHFPGRDELLARALERWERQDRQHLKLSLSAASAAAERLADFVWRTSRQTLTHRVYVALCATPDHPCIGPVLRRVTQRRVKYLAAALEELGLEGIEARHRANLMYSSYVGYLQLQAQGLVPDKDEPDFDDYVQHVIETLIEV